MWQKARIVEFNEPQLIGRTLWVKGPAELRPAITRSTGAQEGVELRIKINIIPYDRRCQFSSMILDRLELLPEFSEKVEMWTWEEFVNSTPQPDGGTRGNV